jgi:N-acetylglucosamine-6-phosphate deacetylase
VTALAPTIITAAPETATSALARLDRARDRATTGARLLGAHVEGPFLSPVRAGTHPPHHLRAPDPELLTTLLEAGDVAITTLAPELDGALDLVRLATARGVTVMAGHSDADAPDHAGFDAGISGATHLFNAMSGFAHRAPGLAAAALAHPGVVVTLIADGHHLAPDVLRVSTHAAAGRRALITDATAASGTPTSACCAPAGSRT